MNLNPKLRLYDLTIFDNDFVLILSFVALSQLRRNNEPIPGCVGDPVYGEDYCRYPDPTAPPTSEPTAGVTEVTASPTAEPTAGVTASPTPEPTVPGTTPTQPPSPPALQLIFTGIGAPESPLLECQGDCDDDSHCAGDLVCFQRYGIFDIERTSTALTSFLWISNDDSRHNDLII